MSIIDGALALFKTQNARQIGPFGKPKGQFTAPCNIMERHTDAYTYTDHPVAAVPNNISGTPYVGALTDHAYRQPKRVEIILAYSLSSGLNAFKQIGSLISSGKPPLSINDYYQMFLDLQGSVKPFTIVTGKRKYKNMVIEEIHETTDAKTENIVRLELRCREILIGSTVIIKNSSDNATYGPVQNNGTVNAASQPQSNLPTP